MPLLSKESRDNVVEGYQFYEWSDDSVENTLMINFKFSEMPVKDERYRLESNRLKTFKNFPDHLKRLVVPLSKSGFYYVNGNGDRRDEVEEVRVNDTVECIFCGITIHDWGRAHRVNDRHKYASGNCPFIQNYNVGNVPITDQYCDSSTHVPTPDRDFFHNYLLNVDPSHVKPCQDKITDGNENDDVDRNEENEP